MDLSVVVPAYNQAELLRHCLQSLVNQTLNPASYEIVVVDDGSTDRTPDVLSEFGARVKPLRLPVNRGRSAARNAGIAAASAPIIVFVDSDVVVETGFLQWHLSTHRRYGPRILARGPVAVIHDLSVVPNGKKPIRASSPAFLDTANASLEKTALEQAGMFDERFPGYGWEDFELGLRLKRAGIKRVFCPPAVAYHVQPPAKLDTVDGLLQKETERARSAVYFLRKHPSLETRLLTQATPLHRGLYWLLAVGGRLTPKAAFSLARRAGDRGIPQLSSLILRLALNWQYAEFLRAEMK